MTRPAANRKSLFFIAATSLLSCGVFSEKMGGKKAREDPRVVQGNVLLSYHVALHYH
jgi:hypothetical protein